MRCSRSDEDSARDSRLVTMRWNGSRSKRTKPIAVVGKGVCFDSGGISIKPAAGMEDMKGDMGGAACVVGLMHALAARKAKVNVVGVIGLVENMPDGDAIRPGDIITSMSGQTIEIVNTDAEGRLVLADALWYTQENIRPAGDHRPRDADRRHHRRARRRRWLDCSPTTTNSPSASRPRERRRAKKSGVCRSAPPTTS